MIIIADGPGFVRIASTLYKPYLPSLETSAFHWWYLGASRPGEMLQMHVFGGSLALPVGL